MRVCGRAWRGGVKRAAIDDADAAGGGEQAPSCEYMMKRTLRSVFFLSTAPHIIAQGHYSRWKPNVSAV